MINYVFRLSMFLLFLDNVKNLLLGDYLKKDYTHYFFISYIAISCFAMLLESLFIISGVAKLLILFTLHLGSFKQHRLSKQLARTFYGYGITAVRLMTVYKYALMVEVGILLIFILVKLLAFLKSIKFSLFLMYHSAKRICGKPSEFAILKKTRIWMSSKFGLKDSP